jgi:hypothetical protein
LFQAILVEELARKWMEEFQEGICGQSGPVGEAYFLFYEVSWI